MKCFINFTNQAIEVESLGRHEDDENGGSEVLRSIIDDRMFSAFKLK